MTAASDRGWGARQAINWLGYFSLGLLVLGLVLNPMFLALVAVGADDVGIRALRGPPAWLVLALIGCLGAATVVALRLLLLRTAALEEELALIRTLQQRGGQADVRRNGPARPE